MKNKILDCWKFHKYKFLGVGRGQQFCLLIIQQTPGFFIDVFPNILLAILDLIMLYWREGITDLTRLFKCRGVCLVLCLNLRSVHTSGAVGMSAKLKNKMATSFCLVLIISIGHLGKFNQVTYVCFTCLSEALISRVQR